MSRLSQQFQAHCTKSRNRINQGGKRSRHSSTEEKCSGTPAYTRQHTRSPLKRTRTLINGAFERNTYTLRDTPRKYLTITSVDCFELVLDKNWLKFMFPARNGHYVYFSGILDSKVRHALCTSLPPHPASRELMYFACGNTAIRKPRHGVDNCL